MDVNLRPSEPAAKTNRLNAWDLTIVLIAISTIVFANVGVVRALDTALDVLHR